MTEYNLGISAAISDGGIDTDTDSQKYPLHLAIKYQDKYTFLTFDPDDLTFGGLYSLDSSYQDSGQCNGVSKRGTGKVSNSGYVIKDGIKSALS